MAPRKTPEADRSTRDRLIAAAAEVFAEDGVAAARLEDIAARAGFTRGALYWNFAGKQDLLHAVLNSFATNALTEVEVRPEALDELIQTAVRSPAFRDRIRTLWLVAVEFALHGIRHSARLRAGLVKRYDDVTAMRLPLLRARLGDVAVRDDELALIGRILQALEDGFMLQWLVDEQKFPIEDWPSAQKWILDGITHELSVGASPWRPASSSRSPRRKPRSRATAR